MRHHRNLIGIALAMHLSAVLAEGSDRKWEVRTETQIIQLSQADGLRMRPRLRDETFVARAVTELHEMVSDGEAKLIAFATTRSPSGVRAVSETVEEIRYQAEWMPPSPPFQLDKSFYDFLEAFYSTPPTDVPVDFETRNAGVTLDLEPTSLNEGRAVDISLAIAHVSYLGERSMLVVDKTDLKFSEPIFRNRNIVAQLTVPSRAWRLVAVNVIDGKEPVMEFTLIRAVTSPVGK